MARIIEFGYFLEGSIVSSARKVFNPIPKFPFLASAETSSKDKSSALKKLLQKIFFGNRYNISKELQNRRIKLDRLPTILRNARSFFAGVLFGHRKT